jgi:hypothetical protein
MFVRAQLAAYLHARSSAGGYYDIHLYARVLRSLKHNGYIDCNIANKWRGTLLQSPSETRGTGLASHLHEMSSVLSN